MPHSISDEVRYRLLSYLNECPEASQRDLARHLGMSVGKVNYCLRALIAKGLLKMRNFRKSSTKGAYAYVLTPQGLEEKVNVTFRFLIRKIEEYEVMAAEIERLRREVNDSDTARDGSTSAVRPSN